MNIKLTCLVAAFAFSLFSGAHAQVQFSYLKDFAGWSVIQMPDGTTTILREERPDVRIILLPEDKTPVKTEAEGFALIDVMKARVAAKYEQCAPIKNKTVNNNGMGFEVQDRDVAPKCYLFISGTKQGFLFASIRLDDGVLDPQSMPSQQTALVFLSLAVARIQGGAFLKKEGDNINLAQFVESIPSQNIPERMVAGARVIETTNMAFAAIPGSNNIHSTITAQRAIPLFSGKTGNACSDWDPSFFTAETLGTIVMKSQWYAHADMYKKIQIPCHSFDWRQGAGANGIEINMGDGWKPMAAALEHNELGPVKAFEKGERLNVQFGDMGRLSKVVSGAAEIKTLRSRDILFKPNGRFWARNLRNPSFPFGIYGSRGRYYVDGHIIVLNIDNGPILVGFGGKIETDGKVTGLFLGGSAYGAFGQ